MSILSTSLSGLLAATTRYTASANNIANAQSTRSSIGDGPYVPEDVVSEESAGGGVSARVQARTPASQPIYDPSDPSADAGGMVQAPNVDPAEELVDQTSATYDFQANLTVMKTQQQMQKSLLDIYV